MKSIFYRENGNAGDAWYYVPLDDETGVVGVERRRAAPGNSGFEQIEISDSWMADTWLRASILTFSARY